jgi:predicted alpha/beta hydrolase
MKTLVRSEIPPELRVEIPATDGCRLIGSLFKPRNDFRRAVIIAPAMGVGQTYYHPFARFLADRGFTVLTFDYRGIGASAREPARSSRARLYHWGRADIAGVLAWMAKLQSNDRLLYIGHSVGTQLLGLTPAVEKIQGLVAVTAPKGYWRLWPSGERLKLFLYWYVVFPMATRLLGYFPARRLGLGLDLPGGVARDWTRWARSPGYVVDEHGRPVLEHFQAIHGPILAYSFTDDARAPAKTVTELLKCFSNASVEHRQIRPAQLGVAAIGHMGFFRESETLRTTLWKEISDWLAAA